MSANLIEKLIESNPIFSGKFMKILSDKVKLPDDKEGVREYIKHPGGVAIIAITADGQIILEHQYRHPVKQIMLEIPAGKIDNPKDTLREGQRELKEETGYTSNNWINLGTCYPSIGYSSEEIIYYLALDCKKGKNCLDDGEFIETITMDIDECLNMAYSGKITDGKTLSGLMLYLGYKNNLSRK